MKKSTTFQVMLFLIAAFSLVRASAQDVFYSINNWDVNGITKYNNVNPTTGAIPSGGTSTFATGDVNTTSAAMGIEPTGQYIYYIPDISNNGGGFTVYSIPANGSASSGTAVLGPSDLNGAATNSVFFRRLAVRKDGYAYMANSEDGTNIVRFARFMTHADGTAGPLELLGTITLDGAAAPPNFYNGDIAFDNNGNMWALVNQNADGGNTFVYEMNAATVNSATNGGTVDMQKKYNIKAPDGGNFPGLITGIAFSSADNLFLAIQDNNGGDNDGGIFFFAKSTDNSQGQAVNAVATQVSSSNGTNIADLASVYYPTTPVLPVKFGAVTATFSNNTLVVNWTTLYEKNNSYFNIEASKDGKNFTKIGTVNTSAKDGNSDTTLSYTFSKSADTAGMALGISFMAIGLVILLLSKKNKILMSLLIFAGLGITATSCSKGGADADITSNGKLFIRIVQVDVDGKTQPSDVVAAYKAD